MQIQNLLGAGLVLLVVLETTHGAGAQDRIVYYAPAIETHTVRKGHSVYYTTNNQIFSMETDGTDVRQLTTGTENCFFPSWSPDKRNILFHRDSSLRIMNTDGTGEFTVATANIVGSDWSPDGSMVCYVGNDASGWPGLWIVSVDPSAKGKKKVGTPLRVRDGNDTYGPAWSPQGNEIAFSSQLDNGGAGPHINILDLTTGTVRSFPHGLLPSWSPAGDRIAFVSRADSNGHPQLYIMNADFSAATQVTSYDDSVAWPTWSPDATQVAFRIGAGPGWDNSALYKLTLDTGTLMLLQEKADHPSWAP